MIVSKRNLLKTVALWVGALGAAYAVGGWGRDRWAAIQREEGDKLVRTAAQLAQEAREAADPGAAARSLAELSKQLGRIPGAKDRPEYAGFLTDLASLEAVQGAGDPAQRRRIRGLLDEAWQVEGLSARVRARIALDQGAMAALDGDLDAAETWYRSSLEADPSGNPAAERLETIARARPVERRERTGP